MKKTLFISIVVVLSGLMLVGCQQTEQLKQKVLTGKVEKVETQNAKVTKKTGITTNGNVVKQAEVEVKKPADVDKVVNEVDKALKDINEDELNIEEFDF